jgi:hypothetical protein
LTGIRQLHELIAGHAEEPDQVVMASKPTLACMFRTYKVTSTATCDRAEQWQPHPGVLFTGHRGPVFEEHLDLEANAHVVDRNSTTSVMSRTSGSSASSTITTT